MDGPTSLAFAMITFVASNPVQKLPKGGNSILAAITVIEGQCQVLREIHGEGDGLEE